MDKIIQIISADNWRAVYLSKEPPYYSVDVVACWALVEIPDEEEVLVKGMDPGGEGFLDFCDGASNFLCYCHVSEMSEALRYDWSKQGEKQAGKA